MKKAQKKEFRMAWQYFLQGRARASPGDVGNQSLKTFSKGWSAGEVAEDFTPHWGTRTLGRELVVPDDVDTVRERVITVDMLLSRHSCRS